MVNLCILWAYDMKEVVGGPILEDLRMDRLWRAVPSGAIDVGELDIFDGSFREKSNPMVEGPSHCRQLVWVVK